MAQIGRRYVKNVAVILGFLLMPAALFAADALPMATTTEAAGATSTEKHFMPLDAARGQASDAQHGIAIIKEKKPFPLRSDSQQLHDGFMRIDRSRTVIIPAQHAVLSKAESAIPAPVAPVEKTGGAPAVMASVNTSPAVDGMEQESEEIEGNREGVDPVLALFGGGSGGAPSSFRDAMRGRVASSIAGIIRHAVWPIPLDAKQYVSSGFGMRADPFNGRQTFHGGIDIAADVGTPVLATADAQVMQVASDSHYGNYITLQHADGMLTRYGHLSVQQVREGERVRAGQVIGAVGATGRATGAHLDYRVSKNGMKFDPLAVLSVPQNVAIKTGGPMARVASIAPDVVVRNGSRVASNATPKRPMVIEVR